MALVCATRRGWIGEAPDAVWTIVLPVRKTDARPVLTVGFTFVSAFCAVTLSALHPCEGRMGGNRFTASVSPIWATELPDEDRPVWTSEDALWAVKPRDFGGDVFAVARFLEEREAFFLKAESVGVHRSVFLPFEPNKPDFEDRAKVLRKLLGAVGWAAG